MNILLIYVIVLALVACFPMVLDIFLAYRSKNRTQGLLIEKVSHDKLDLRKLIEESKSAPDGISGLARTTMALTVIVILGISVFHILVKDPTKNNSQIVSNILSMLSGLLAAITGFYFGGKTSEKKKEEEKNEK